jgi:hypothetical protein
MSKELIETSKCMEVNCTETSPSLRLPCPHYHFPKRGSKQGIQLSSYPPFQCQNDKMTSWQNDKTKNEELTKWQLVQDTSTQNDKLTKIEDFKMKSWWYSAKWQTGEMTTKQSDKLTE